MYTRQSDNIIGGDNAARDIIKHHTYNVINSPSSDELALLYAKLKVDGVGEPASTGFSHKLQHYMAVPTDGDVRGLEEKLKSSGRLDMLNFAIQ